MTAEKFLRVTMPDGSEWDVPAHVIADDRARYYAESDPHTTYQEAYDETISDPSDLIEWAEGDMNWSDVVAHAVKVETQARAVDYQDGWVNGDKRVIER